MGWLLLGLASDVAKISLVKVSMANCFGVDYLSVVCCLPDMKYNIFLGGNISFLGAGNATEWGELLHF